MGIVSTVEETLAAALRSATELDEGKRRHRRAIKTCWAYPDLVLSDPATVCDAATFAEPTKSAEGTLKTWINGVAGKGAVAEHAGDWGRATAIKTRAPEVWSGRPPRRMCSMIGRSGHINEFSVTQPVYICYVGLVCWTISRMQLNSRTCAPNADHQ
jgi:hypothetical protein